MPELVIPTLALHKGLLASHEEWGPGQHEDGFGIAASDDVASEAGFSEWLQHILALSGPGPVGQHRAIFRWIVEDGQVNGGIALRYGADDDYTRWAGHIGFGIRPSARRRGLGVWALQRMLPEAARLGMDKVLLVCAVPNTASAKTIESAGGVFETIGESPYGPVRRYWITTI